MSAFLSVMSDTPVLLATVRAGGAAEIEQKLVAHVGVMTDMIGKVEFDKQVEIMALFYPALETCIHQLGENEKTANRPIRSTLRKSFAVLSG
eukprot:4962522-Pyramimonas_sp.AAC.1